MLILAAFGNQYSVVNCLSFGGLAPVFPVESFNAPGCVNELLLAREEGVAIRTDFKPDFWPGRARLPGLATSAMHGRLLVFRMYIWLHLVTLAPVTSLSSVETLKTNQSPAYLSRRVLASEDFDDLEKKIGDAAWEDCVALCPVTVLTPVTEESRTGSDVVITRISCPTHPCAIRMPKNRITRIGYKGPVFRKLSRFFNSLSFPVENGCV